MEKTVRLKNGLTIVMERMENIRSVSAGIFVKNGSIYENTDNNGISHFIEHILFKGSVNRTGKAIASIMDNLGGNMNALTAKEFTSFYFKTLDVNFKKAMEIMSDMVLHPAFLEDEIEKEANVIISEIAEDEDDPSNQIFERLHSGVFADSTLAYPILGNKTNIKKLNRSIVKDYYEKHYTADKMVVAVVGNIDFDETEEIIKEYFDDLKSESFCFDYQKPKYKKCSLVVNKDVELSHICVAFPGVKLDDRDSYALNAAATELGGGMSSRLYQKIREEHSLAYTVFAANYSYTDEGVFVIYAAVNHNKIEETIGIIKNVIEEFKSEGITDETLETLKNRQKSNILISLESNGGKMLSKGRSQLLLNKIKTIEEITEEIDAVNAQAVNKIAGNIFNFDEMSTVIYTPGS